MAQQRLSKARVVTMEVHSCGTRMVTSVGKSHNLTGNDCLPQGACFGVCVARAHVADPDDRGWRSPVGCSQPQGPALPHIPARLNL